jgi:putative DNA primase/helicase
MSRSTYSFTASQAHAAHPNAEFFVTRPFCSVLTKGSRFLLNRASTPAFDQRIQFSAPFLITNPKIVSRLSQSAICEHETLPTYGSTMDARYSIEGEGCDEVGRRYFKIAVRGSQTPLTIPAESIVRDPSKLFAALTNAGVNVFSRESRTALLEELQSVSADNPSFRVITKVGHAGKQYVLPTQTFGTSKFPTVTVLDHLDQAMITKYRSRGTLEEWQAQIAAPACDNSRLMFGIALAFTGPILRCVKGPRTGGFQISGPAETGKTTAATVAGSVWGCHVGAERQEKGFAESWHTTEGKVEKTAMAHNNTLLILDETQRAGRTARHRAAVISDIAFSLAEGVERERLTNTSSVRAWGLYYLSTSNLTFSELARAGGIEIDDAYLGRLFDIPCPSSQHGIYEDLHEFRNGERLTDALKQRCRRFFGTASPEFARLMLKHRDKDRADLQKLLAKYRARYRKVLRQAIQAEGLRCLTRTASRFATVYAAGRLAIRYEILPWSSKRMRQAILECQLAGLRQLAREPRTTPSEAALRAKLVGYLRDNRNSFVDLGSRRPKKGVDDLEAAAGYVGSDREAGWLYLTDKKVKAIIGNGPTATALKAHLLAEGYMFKPKQGFVVQRRIFTGGKGNQNYAWVCAFKPTLVDA